MQVEFKAVSRPKFGPHLVVNALTRLSILCFFSKIQAVNVGVKLRSQPKRWFLGPSLQGRDFGRAFSNCTYFQACDQFSLSSVQRARRLDGEKRKKEESVVKHKSAAMYVGPPKKQSKRPLEAGHHCASHSSSLSVRLRPRWSLHHSQDSLQIDWGPTFKGRGRKPTSRRWEGKTEEEGKGMTLSKQRKSTKICSGASVTREPVVIVTRCIRIRVCALELLFSKHVVNVWNPLLQKVDFHHHHHHHHIFIVDCQIAERQDNKCTK